MRVLHLTWIPLGLGVTGLLLAGTILPVARAYDGDEHRLLGDAGLFVAMQVLRQGCASQDEACMRRVEQVIADTEKFTGCKNGNPPCAPASYGWFVEVVDATVNPLEPLAAHGLVSGLPGNWEQLKRTQYFLDAPNAVQDLGARANAATENAGHFQLATLASQRRLHAQALEAAVAARPGKERADGESLFSALILNAFSNHYLQDFLAPGHMLTPRDGLTDPMSEALHDRANELGFGFFPEGMSGGEGDPGGMTAIFRFLCDPSDQDGWKDAGSSARDRWAGYAKELPFDCRSVRNVQKRDLRLQLFGDGHLRDLSGSREDADEQRVFLLAVTARSILDVLESYRNALAGTGSPVVNHFTRYVWISATTADAQSGYLGHPVVHKSLVPLRGPDYATPIAGFDYGMYEVEVSPPLHGQNRWKARSFADIAAHPGAPGASPVPGQTEAQAQLAALSGFEKGSPEKLSDERRHGPDDTVYGVTGLVLQASARSETVFSHGTSSRWGGSLEASWPTFWPGSRDWMRDSKYRPLKLFGSDVNLVPEFGWTALHGGPLHAQGPSASLTGSFPNLDSHLGVYFRELEYKRSDRSERQPSYGFRLDIGFSMVTAYFGFGRDVGIEGSGFGRGTMASAGISLNFPWSSLEGWAKEHLASHGAAQ